MKTAWNVAVVIADLGRWFSFRSSSLSLSPTPQCWNLKTSSPQVGHSLYTKGNLLLCKRDYLRYNSNSNSNSKETTWGTGNNSNTWELLKVTNVQTIKNLRWKYLKYLRPRVAGSDLRSHISRIELTQISWIRLCALQRYVSAGCLAQRGTVPPVIR